MISRVEVLEAKFAEASAQGESSQGIYKPQPPESHSLLRGEEVHVKTGMKKKAETNPEGLLTSAKKARSLR